MEFASLHTHTEFSLRDGFAKVDRIAQAILLFDQPAFAITDHGTCSGLMAGFKAAKEHGLKFIPGCEHYYVDDVTLKVRPKTHVLFLAKDYNGYQNLMALTSDAHRNFYHKPRIDMHMVRKYAKGLICTTACLGGILAREDGEKLLLELKSIFGDDLYIEIHTNSIPEQKPFNLRNIELGNKHNVKYYPATDSHYVSPKDARYHKLWVGVGDDEERYMTDDFFLHSTADVRKALAYVGETTLDAMFDTLKEVVDKCNVVLPTGEKNYPIYPTNDAQKAIRDKVWKGCKALGIDKSPLHIEQIRKEISVLTAADYNNYFLIMDSVVSWCHNNNIRVGTGRGSVVGSLVAYTMGLTNLDPLKYDLIFERFCHLERVTAADVDTDLPKSRRQDVIRHIENTYGQVYRVKTFNYMADKAALRRAGQALKTPIPVIDFLSKNDKLEDLPESAPKELAQYNMWDFEYSDLVETAKRFRGILQNYGVHASAIMVLPDAPYKWCAAEKCKDVDGQETFALNYDFHDLEKMGLLKLDILGLATLDTIENCLQLIGEDIDLLNLPQDPKTYKMLCAGRTAGLFQIESDGMTGLVKKMQPNNINDLIACVALFRPGILQSGMLNQFLAGQKGQLLKEEIHPLITPILKDTHGVIVYQEQVIKAVQVMFGLSLGEADMVRRAIGRKEKEVLDKEIEKLAVKGEELGISRDESARVLGIISECSDYLFNKSHAAAYGYTAYQTAYLKANYPLQFMCSALNTELGDTEKTLKYVDECRHLNIKVLPPSAYYSDMMWTIESGALRMGLGCIKGVGKGVQIVKTDPKGGIKFFMHKNRTINKGAIEPIIKAGCFAESRRWSLEYATWAKEVYSRRYECQQKINDYTASGKVKLATQWQEKIKLIPIPPSYHETIETENVAYEKEVLGFSFGDNLCDYDLSYADRNPQSCVGGEIVKYRKHKTKTGKPMAFVTIQGHQAQRDYVSFDDKVVLNVGKVYLLRINAKGHIVDATEAQKKNQA